MPVGSKRTWTLGQHTSTTAREYVPRSPKHGPYRSGFRKRDTSWPRLRLDSTALQRSSLRFPEGFVGNGHADRCTPQSKVSAKQPQSSATWASRLPTATKLHTQFSNMEPTLCRLPVESDRKSKAIGPSQRSSVAAYHRRRPGGCRKQRPAKSQVDERVYLSVVDVELRSR